MWILESDGEFLAGRRIWLKPGKRYLFGRVKKEGVAHAIDHKTISRKHFVIEVAPVKPGQGSQILTRSKITVTDEKTKGGTFIDGVELKDGSRELKGLEHRIRPGKYPQQLKVKWHQVCLSFSFSSKELKADPLTPRRQRLEDLDIKTVVDYVVGETTHVVATKRNTAKGLQALINGKYIVNDSYIDAIVYAATSEDLAEPENLCPLERDFDAAWPDPAKHLPPPGKEIIDMPAAASNGCFNPRPERQTIFENFIFVCCSKEQYENLLPMITSGHGKGLLYPMDIGKTTVDELELYMRNTAGKKGFGEADSQQGKGGVVLVRWVARGAMQQWADALADEVSLRIDQRPIDQGDFLNIILNNAPHLLRRPCGFSSTAESSTALPKAFVRTIDATQGSPPRPIIKPPGSSPPQATTTNLPDSQTEMSRRRPSPDDNEQPPLKRQRIRGIIRSRFKTFDDGLDIDIDSVPSYQPTQVSTDDNMAVSQTPQPVAVEDDVRSAASPARSLEPESPSEEPGDLEDLLPAATAMKKHRLEMEHRDKKSKKSSQAIASQPPKKSRKEHEMDVLKAARKQREAEEEALRKNQEALEHAGIDVENARNLAVVVEMDVPVRTGKPLPADGEAGDRWDEKWNGRKNFKKFRRKGDEDSRSRHVQNVIVPLEEVKKPSYGIGQEYWHDTNRSRKNTHVQRSNASQSQPIAEFGSGTAGEPASQSSTRLQHEAEEMVGTIDVDEPRSTRATQQSSSRSQQTLSMKRVASDQNRTAAKRQKMLRTHTDDDSDDELKFRFGRRKK